MQGFVNRDALATTISSRKATFYSRSRSKLWTKGESSMNFINIHDIFLDCDRDSVSSDHFHYILFVLILCTLFLLEFMPICQVIYLGKTDGPTCHTGAETCYYTSIFVFNFFYTSETCCNYFIFHYLFFFFLSLHCNNLIWVKS